MAQRAIDRLEHSVVIKYGQNGQNAGARTDGTKPSVWRSIAKYFIDGNQPNVAIEPF